MPTAIKDTMLIEICHRKDTRRYAGGIIEEYASLEKIAIIFTLINILSPFETWLSETEPHYYSNIKEYTRKGSSTASEEDVEIAYNTNNETCNTNIRKAKQSAINSYSTYHQNKLILSNDIETQPGPENTTLLKILILLILAIALKKAKADVKSLSHHSQTVFSFNTIQGCHW